MNKLQTVLCLGILLISSPLAASGDEAVLASLLDDFLAGASVNDRAAHERFWADELIYTSSGGARFGKADILQELGEEADGTEKAPEMVYSAQDVQVRLYRDTAVVAFRLLGTGREETGQPLQFFNTGTFVKRGGEWRAVAWQATRIPREE